jgi:serine/threonine protein kinase
MTNVGNVKLSDFGLSLNRLALGGEISNISCAANWAAPEIIEHKVSSTDSDIWSLGCTVIELLTGQPPYGDIPDMMSGARTHSQCSPGCLAELRKTCYDSNIPDSHG